MEFMLGAVMMDPKKRMTLGQLLNHPFIKLHQEEKLGTQPLDYTTLINQSNLFKFQTAVVINQIMYRKKMINANKMKKIESI